MRRMRSLLLALLLLPSAQDASAWEKAAKGVVEGTLAFPGSRPRQPVVVYLERADAPEFVVPVDPLVVGQKDARFDPPFLVVVVGRKVVFDNNEEESIDHNVYTLGVEEKDFGIFGRGKRVEHVFDKPGEVRLHCSIHKFMDGKVFVTPTPAFAVLGAEESSFTIRDVPEGRWTLRTYQKARRFHDAEMAVDVRKDETATVKVELTR